MSDDYPNRLVAVINAKDAQIEKMRREHAYRISQQDAELERMRRELADMTISRDGYAKQAMAREAEGRRKAFIEAAEIAENYSELRDIDWWLSATKKEVSADVSVSIGTILRKKAEEART